MAVKRQRDKYGNTRRFLSSKNSQHNNGEKASKNSYGALNYKQWKPIHND